MWTRKELKQRAKDALKRNYWKIIFVTFLAVILGGGMPAASAGGGQTVDEEKHETIVSEWSDDMGIPVYENTSNSEESTLFRITENAMARSRDALFANSQGMSDMQQMTATLLLIVVFLTISLFIMVFVYALITLLYNPFYTGVCRFMLKSVDDRAEVKEVAYGFDHSYKNVVKTMFHADLRIFLWALLFIIPGIYKKYQYRMVPYILAEHPDMDYKEALQLSIDIMNGEKWHAFVLDFSFIPWRLLGMITCGIVGVFYVNAYIYLTNAALYRKLCEVQDDNRQPALV